VRPIELHSLLPRKPIVKKQFLMPASMFVHQPRYFDVETTILRDLEEPAFPLPFDRI
jgi:hypothetical protein